MNIFDAFKKILYYPGPTQVEPAIMLTEVVMDFNKDELKTYLDWKSVNDIVLAIVFTESHLFDGRFQKDAAWLFAGSTLYNFNSFQRAIDEKIYTETEIRELLRTSKIKTLKLLIEMVEENDN